MANDSGHAGSYTFQAVGWQEWTTRNRRRGQPRNPQDAHGILVRYYDPDFPDDQGMFWAYTRNQFQDWAEWWVYIEGLMKMHGMELADEEESA